MNSLKVLWTPSDVLSVEVALKNLFRVQGYKGSDTNLAELVGLLVGELSLRRSPPKAIIAGLNDLKFEDVSKINLFLIENAAKKYIEVEKERSVECDFCFGSGIISMRNEAKYEFALACTCEKGDSFASRGNARWKGEAVQDGKHGLYELRFPDILKNKLEVRERVY